MNTDVKHDNKCRSKICDCEQICDVSIFELRKLMIIVSIFVLLGANVACFETDDAGHMAQAHVCIQ